MPDGVIGSVSVTVTPDASDFVRRFEEQTGARMRETGRRQGDEWRRDFESTASRAEVHVRVRADTSQARKDIGNLKADLIKTLAPALVPVAGAAVAAGGALASMGVAGILAFKGIQAEIKKNSGLGQQFSAQIGAAKQALGGLEQTAAKNFLSGFQSSVGKLNQALPGFNNTVAASSKVLGDIASHLSGALASGFTTFGPVILEVETAIDGLAQKFEKFVTSANGQAFAQNLATDFKQVVHVISDLAAAFGKVIAAAAPVGGAVLDAIDGIARAISSIPLPVLTGLVTAMTTLSTIRLASAGLTSLGGALGIVRTNAAGASEGVGRLGLAFSRAVPYLAAAIGAGVGFNALARSTDNWATSANRAQFAIHQTATGLGEIFTGNFSKGFSDLFGDGLRKANQLTSQVNAMSDSVRSLLAPPSGQNSWLGGLDPHKVETVRKQLKMLGTDYLNLKTGKTKVTGEGSFGPALQAQAGEAAAAAGDPFAARQSTQTKGMQIATARAKEYRAAVSDLNRQLTNFYTAAGKSSSVSSLSQSYDTQASAIQKVASQQDKLLTAGKQVGPLYHGMAIRAGAYGAALVQTGGNEEKALGIVEAQIDSYHRNGAATKELQTESLRLATATSYVAAKYKLTSDQVDLYTQVAGINTEALAKGYITAGYYAQQIGAVARAVNNGSTATMGLVSAIADFNKSGKTAADRGALIGQVLKAANGDTLQFQSTINQTAVANKQFATDLKSAGRGVINLQKGSIAYHKAGAEPLLADLSQMQTAAVNAAAATYQHETAMHKAGAASDAFKVYVANTTGELRKQFVQMGYSAPAADRLAKKYFDIKNSGDLKKRIEAIGSGKVVSVLKQILADLNIISGKTFGFTVDGHLTNAAKHALAVSGKDPSRVTSKLDSPNIRASGGMIHGPGTGTSDSVPAWLSNGEFVINAKATSRNLSLLQAINSGAKGFASGGMVGGYAAIANLLKSLGATRAGIAGFLGNTKIESGGSTTAHNAGENAWGLQQWEGGRLTQLKRLAANMGVSYKSQAAQLAMIKKELTGGYGDTLKKLRTAKSATSAAAYVDANYERSSGSARGARESAAAAFFKSAVSKGKGGTYKVNGIEYSTSTAARNAQVRASQATAKAADRFLAAAKNSKETYSQLSTAAAALKNAAHRQVAGVTTILADAKKRDQVRARLTTAQDTLKTAKANYTSAFNSAHSSINQVDFTSLGVPQQVYSDQAASKPSAAGFITGYRGVVAKAKSFAAVIKKLVQEGMPRGIVMQLLAAGPAALDQATALSKSTPAQLKTIKSLYTEQNAAASVGSKAIADKYYLAGVQSAQGLVKGLLSQESSLNKAIDHLTAAMVKRVKKNLKIHSPSQVMRWHGQMSGEGFALGVDDKLARIEQASSKMAGVPPRPARPRLNLDGLSGATTAGPAVEQHHHYSYTINAMDWSPEAVVNAMRRREIRDTMSNALLRRAANF